MTADYLARRVLIKGRELRDLDLFTRKRMNYLNVYMVFNLLIIDFIILSHVLFGLKIGDIQDMGVVFVVFPNLMLIYLVTRVLSYRKESKIDLPNPSRYIIDVENYSGDERRSLVNQINNRKRSMKYFADKVTAEQKLNPFFFIIPAIASMIVYYNKEGEINFPLFFLISLLIINSIGFLIATRKSRFSFSQMQNSVVFRLRNPIIDALLVSILNPGSNENRK